MKEVLDYYKSKIEKSEILHHLSLKANQYFMVSFHREENVDNEENLLKILRTLNSLAEKYQLPVIVSTHPRTSKKLELLSGINHQPSALIHFLKPFGFFDYINLQMKALCTLSDSGTVSEESAILSFPAISIRNSMERPEAQDAGSIILSGLEPDIVLESVTIMTNSKNSTSVTIPAEYSINNTSFRVIRLITGLTKLSNSWAGIY